MWKNETVSGQNELNTRHCRRSNQQGLHRVTETCNFLFLHKICCLNILIHKNTGMIYIIENCFHDATILSFELKHIYVIKCILLYVTTKIRKCLLFYFWRKLDIFYQNQYINCQRNGEGPHILYQVFSREIATQTAPKSQSVNHLHRKYRKLGATMQYIMQYSKTTTFLVKHNYHFKVIFLCGISANHGIWRLIWRLIRAGVTLLGILEYITMDHLGIESSVVK